MGSEGLYNICNNFIANDTYGWAAPNPDGISSWAKQLNNHPVVRVVSHVQTTRGKEDAYIIVSWHRVEDMPLVCVIRELRDTPEINGIRIEGCIAGAYANPYPTSLEATCAEEASSLRRLDLRLAFPRGTKISEANSLVASLESAGPPIGLPMAAQNVRPTHGSNNLWSQCAPTNQNLTVTNAESFVNLRSKAGFSSSVVAEIPLGNGVTFASEITANTNASGKNCRALCIGARDAKLSAAQQTELNSCFEDNAIWYRVRASNGKTGWISGKYLDVVN